MIDLSDHPFVDGHMHPPLRELPRTADGYRWPWYEGREGSVALAADLPTYRAAIAEVAGHLGVAADEEAVVAAVAAREVEEWTAETMRWGGVDALVMDMGYPPPGDAMDVDTARRAAAVTVWPLLRIERLAGDLVGEAASFDEFADRFDAELRAAPERGFRGLKSIIAYRTGLAVEPVDRAAATEAFAEQRRLGERIVVKPLLDHLLVRALAVAREVGLPLQLHSGYGDRDLDLRLGNPLVLRPLLESGAADGVPLVLLHGAWPYTREAAYLAAVHADVYLDIATCIPPIAHGEQVWMWRVALAVAPGTRVQASSDAAGLPEQVALGARWARRSLGEALGELVAAHALTAAEAESAAARILHETSRRVYGGA